VTATPKKVPVRVGGLDWSRSKVEGWESGECTNHWTQADLKTDILVKRPSMFRKFDEIRIAETFDAVIPDWCELVEETPRVVDRKCSDCRHVESGTPDECDACDNWHSNWEKQDKPTFKAGDKVIARKGADAKRLRWIPAMDCLDGSTLTIRGGREGVWHVEETHFRFAERWLTPVAKDEWAPKVGEWVEIGESQLTGAKDLRHGMVFKITELTHYGIAGGAPDGDRTDVGWLKPHKPSCGNCEHGVFPVCPYLADCGVRGPNAYNCYKPKKKED
jgi:hypothetical protein